MERLKAWFVSLSGLVAMAIAGHAIVAMVGGGPVLVWAGPLVGSTAFLLTMGWILFGGRARTSDELPLTLAGAAAGVLLAGAGALFVAVAPVALAEAAASAAIIFLYVFWYSRLDRRGSASLEVGKRLPDLVFVDGSGQQVDLAALGDGPLLLLFYRGNWCPFCNAQIREIAAQYRQLEERGVTVAFISPQSHEKTRQFADRFDNPAHFLSDPGGRVAKSLGISHEGGVPAGFELMGYDSDTVLPTVIVADAQGTVLWADQTDNYRVRPEPATFLAVLAAHVPASAAA